MDSMNTSDPTRQYGAAIALVSGVYSLISATGGIGMMGSNSGLLMALLGVIVLVHGVVLLTSYASRPGKASGPLMIGYSLVMLRNQTLVDPTGSTNWGLSRGSGMDGGLTGGMKSTMTAGMGDLGMGDLGMVALAVLMLSRGVSMTNRAGSATGM